MNRLPEEIVTPRLILRVPTVADAPEINRAIRDSFAELNEWMPWAVEPQTMEESEEFCTKSRRKWRDDSEYAVLMILKESGALVGGCGFPKLDWEVPKFEVGYWCHSAHVGRGYVSEATHALTLLAFDRFDAVRVEIRMDDNNERSWRVAQRLGFELEGVIHAETRTNNGSLRDTRVYALFSSLGLQGFPGETP